MHEQQADDVLTEDELVDQKRLVGAVIQHLITNERCIIGDEVCTECVCTVCVCMCVYAYT